MVRRQQMKDGQSDGGALLELLKRVNIDNFMQMVRRSGLITAEQRAMVQAFRELCK